MVTRAERREDDRLGRIAASLAAYAELSRISNLPTCLTNVLVGCSLGAAVGAGPLDWTTVARLSLAVACLYVAGMALNGAADVAVDRIERPDRPIPSGRISLSAAYLFTVVCIVGAFATVAPLGAPAQVLTLSLVAVIIAYNFLHDRLPGSAALMGLCRGLVYLVCAAAVSWPLDLPRVAGFAAVLTVYTVGLTWVAQAEMETSVGVRRWTALALPVVVLLPVWRVRPEQWGWAVLAAIMLIAWLSVAIRFVLRRPPRIVPAILTWLSGICLVDAWFLTLLDRPGLAGIAIVCFAVTAWGHRHILGT